MSGLISRMKKCVQACTFTRGSPVFAVYVWVGVCVCVCFVSTSADRVVTKLFPEVESALQGVQNPSIPVKYTPKHYIYTNIVLLWQQVTCRHQWLVLVIHECRYRNIVNLPMYLISPLRKKLFQSGFFLCLVSLPQRQKCKLVVTTFVLLKSSGFWCQSYQRNVCRRPKLRKCLWLS